MKDAMTLHHRRLARLAAKRRASKTSRRLKALRQGRIDRQVLSMMRPELSPGQRDDFFRWRDLRKHLRGVAVQERLQLLTKSGWARLDVFMTSKGWQIDDGIRCPYRYKWPEFWGGAVVITI